MKTGQVLKWLQLKWQCEDPAGHGGFFGRNGLEVADQVTTHITKTKCSQVESYLNNFSYVFIMLAMSDVIYCHNDCLLVALAHSQRTIG